jgi:tetratricopeptide (TPR) repeat protein
MNTLGKIWRRSDGLAAAVAALISGAVYFWTAAPNVTLLDSGEFIVAAQHLGVPHPTGYPLWTLLAWLFQLLPLGNAAWEVNLFSGVCGALATGLLAALFSSSTRWMIGDRLVPWRGLNTSAAITTALLFAFSFSMWSQGVIAEVYTLHALLVGLFLTSLYVWLRKPGSVALLFVPFFLLALSFSNHQLSIVLSPLPLLAVLLVRPRIFWDLVASCGLTALLAYLGFAILSGDLPILKTAIRFFYCVLLGLAVLLVARRFKVQWRLIAYMPFVVALGLLPYAYMPLASSTNPPMNWAYTKTVEGFFFSFNRSQYSGSLTGQSMRSLGSLMGTGGGGRGSSGAEARGPEEQALLQRLQEWVGFFWFQLGKSFTPIGVVAYFLALLVVLRLPDLAARTWVYVLEVAFVLAAILQPVADGARTDLGGWWLQMPYHTYTNFIFALLAGLGIVAGAAALFAKLPGLSFLRFGLPLLAAWPLFFNHDGCSQRGRWFGWQYGHDMLKDLPLGSVVLGGTDPGRFVPTYMILGESPQAPTLKRDPGFDRRDLYLITQNGVGEHLYRRYLEDHYGANRPKAESFFERWLGRDSIYPATPLVFPTENEIEKSIAKESEALGSDLPDPSLPHSVVTRLLWEKNRDRHEFFVEESFPLEWSYGHAMPHGLLYRINKEPVEKLPPEVVREDFTFWEGYVSRLLADPAYSKDFDAKRSFSKLRATTGNLYRHRKMEVEAERAYRQSLQLWEGNGESISALSAMLWEREDFEGILEMLGNAAQEDPNNYSLWRMYFTAEKRQQMATRVAELHNALASGEPDEKVARELLELHSSLGDAKSLQDELEALLPKFNEHPAILRMAVRLAESAKLQKIGLDAARILVLVEPDDADNHLLLARLEIQGGQTNNAMEAARAAIMKGGLPIREALEKSKVFEPLWTLPEFESLIRN